MSDYKTYNHCRLSTEHPLIDLLHFTTALAGDFHKSENECSGERAFPLTLSICKTCGLVQVKEVVAAETMFQNYFYKTGTIGSLVKHFQDLQQTLSDELEFNSVLEIGCNDFTFLKNFLDEESKLKLVGVDPSDIARQSAPDGIQLYNDYFNEGVAETIADEHGTFDLITTSNAFAHIEDILSVTKGVKSLLADNGTLVIEVHWVGNLLEKLQFPFIYHEHMYYYSLHSLQHLLNMFELEAYRISEIDIHGGSMRVYCCHAGRKKIETSIEKFIQKEQAMRLSETSTYVDFKNKVDDTKTATMRFLQKLRDGGKTVFGYGASGQANTLMAYYGITNAHIEMMIDDSPVKIGCYTPNNCIPIRSSETLQTHCPDYIVCFAYTFFNEIKERNSDLDTKWIIPLPELRVE